MQLKVVAALVALVLLSAPPAVLAAATVRDHRRARRPLPGRARLARLALALNCEWAATPAQCRLVRLRQSLFESGVLARRVVSAHDDPHAEWLLADALRLARRLDDELRGLWSLVDAVPDHLERSAVRVEAVRGVLDRLREAVSIRAGEAVDEVLDHLALGVETEREVRLQVTGLHDAAG